MASSRPRPSGTSSSTGEEALRTRENAENFPVALRFLPRRHRDHLHAIYGYARMVDEIGDAFTGDRTARLHELSRGPRHDLGGRSAVGRRTAEAGPDGARPRMSAEPFERLIEANLQDQVVSRYATFDDLRGYCALSAEPVGRIVLEVFGQATPQTIALSDRVCTALQLLEHWQDVGEDRRAGRVYLPQEDLAALRRRRARPGSAERGVHGFAS